MKRIVFLVIRLIHRIPGWLLKINSYKKHKDEVPFEERYNFMHKVIQKIDEKSRVTIECYGKENLPKEQGYLMTPNHQGLFDALILFDTHDKPFRAILKQELMSVFVLGNILKMLEFVAIDRDNLRNTMKAIRKASQEMQEGINYVIFPEGTRCRNKNKMLEFKGGTFKAAIDGQRTIVPVALIDCYKVFDDNTIAPVVTQIHYLKPIPYDEYKDMNSIEIAQCVQCRIQKCIEENEK